MLDLGTKIITLRKQKKWSQDDLAKAVNVSQSIIGKYERNENQPSIEAALKLAKAFNVTLDYLIGDSEISGYDKQTINRIKDIQKMDDKTQTVLFDVIDTYIQNFKTKQAFA